MPTAVLDRRLEQGTGPERGESRRCLRCGAATREGKPYCTDHVLEMPAARAANEEVQARLAAAEGGPLCESLIHDAAILLETCGALTISKLAREMHIPPGLGWRLARRLVRERKARWGKPTRRGAQVLEHPEFRGRSR